MQRKIVWLLWSLASLLGLGWGVRLAFFPSIMEGRQLATPTGDGPEITRATYEPMFVYVLLVLTLFYALLGFALYARHYSIFGLITGIHIVLSMLSAASIGTPLLPSSAFLFLAAMLTVGLPQDAPAAPLAQQRRNGV